MDVSERCLRKICAGKSAVGGPHLSQRGLGEVGTGEVAAHELDVGETCMLEAHSGEAGSGEPAPRDVAVRYRPTGEVLLADLDVCELGVVVEVVDVEAGAGEFDPAQRTGALVSPRCRGSNE